MITANLIRYKISASQVEDYPPLDGYLLQRHLSLFHDLYVGGLGQQQRVEHAPQGFIFMLRQFYVGCVVRAK